MKNPEEKLNQAESEKQPLYKVEALKDIDDSTVSKIKDIDRKIFPTEMQVPAEEIKMSLQSEGAQVVLRDDSNEIVGYITSLPQNQTFDFISEFDPEFKKDDSGLYIESIGVEKQHRSLENFNNLIGVFKTVAQEKGFKKVVAHVRVSEGLSDILQRKFKAKVLRRIENWAGFGEPFDYLEIAID